jgi:uncharacterized membrane protein YphA (DoxX/SURF4 family)
MATTRQSGGKLVWAIQILLALLFAFAGASKFAMSDQELTAQTPVFSPLFLHFIGVCELLGAAGVILPVLLNIRPGLTPLAAAGLVMIMIGATISTALLVSIPMAIMPAVAGLLAAYVACVRWPLLRGTRTAREEFA